ncbi:hypothetical protein ACQKI9_29925, partial [Achromobacter xylosoxidans]
MSAKGFLSSPAATVEQAVAWLHSRVSLTAHLKLDSREIEPGDVFVACPGLSSDGRVAKAGRQSNPIRIRTR